MPESLPAEEPSEPARGPVELHVCVVDDGRLHDVRAAFDPATGDTLYTGRPFREAFSDTAGYAANKPWFAANEPITWERRRYTRYAPPRILSPDDLRPAGEHGGVVIFIEANAVGVPGVLYVPTRPGCEFQSYQWDLITGGIRGG